MFRFREPSELTRAVVRLSTFDLLKHSARQQLPGVKHAHLIEALSWALGSNNYAALKERLKGQGGDPARVLMFSTQDLRQRLRELGYESAGTAPLEFAGLTEIFRKPPPMPTLSELEASGKMTSELRVEIDRIIDERQSVLITGRTSTGKTTLMVAMLQEMATRSSVDRLTLFEQVQEADELPSNVTRIEIPPPELMLFEAKKFRGSRVVIDEIRGDLDFSLVQEWRETGGGIGILHASDGEQCINRLTQVVSRSSDREPAFVRSYLKETIGAIIVCDHVKDSFIWQISTSETLRNVTW